MGERGIRTWTFAYSENNVYVHLEVFLQQLWSSHLELFFTHCVIQTQGLGEENAKLLGIK